MDELILYGWASLPRSESDKGETTKLHATEPGSPGLKPEMLSTKTPLFHITFIHKLMLFQSLIFVTILLNIEL